MAKSMLLFFFAISALGQDSNAAMQKTLEAFTAAFNKHDIEGMLTHVTEDLLYMYVADDQIAVETRDKAALSKAMQAYFKQIPSARSEMEAVIFNGHFASVRERAHWKGKNGAQSQASLAIYQFKDGKIHRVWYYPAQK